MTDKQTIQFRMPSTLDNVEKQCVLDTIREAVIADGGGPSALRARRAAEAALAGIATLRGNDGPVVLKRKGQGQRELADELEEMASQLRRDADAWDAEIEAITRSATSARQGSAEEGSSATPAIHLPDPRLRGMRDPGDAND